MLIVIEGLDGSGKSTQVRKLKKYLEEVSKELESISTSRGMMQKSTGSLSASSSGAVSAVLIPSTPSWWPCSMRRTGTVLLLG